MPLYEYRCKACGHVMEVLQKLSDPPVRKCDQCSGRSVEKLLSRTSFQLKGGGWYGEGYGKTPPSPKPPESAGSGSDKTSPDKSTDRGSSGESKDQGSSEKKPDGKASKASCSAGTRSAAAG